jgi:hypothetical protein
MNYITLTNVSKREKFFMVFVVTHAETDISQSNVVHFVLNNISALTEIEIEAASNLNSYQSKESTYQRYSISSSSTIM